MTAISTNFAARLESLIGPSRISTDAAARACYAVDELLPTAVAKPTSAEEVAETVRFAVLEKLALIPCGNRTKLAIGTPPSHYDIALDMTALNRIPHYDPGDLTVGAEVGMPLAKLNSVLNQHKQFLPLLVPWYSLGTIGGTIASGIDSPLRQFYGTARDFLIGAEFVDGTGHLCKSGGRVVKNVTGYDLHKLLIGSLGTLAVITRLNFRTFPMPQAQGTFVATFSSAEAAFDFCRMVSHSVLTPQIVEVANPGAAALIFSGEFSARIEPRIWFVIVSAAGQPAVVQRHE